MARTSKKVKNQAEEFIHTLQAKRKISAQGLMNDLMELAPAAIKFKKRLMEDPNVPTYLKLKNADDILDRTVSKPSQKITVDGTMISRNMTDRELDHLLRRKLQEKFTEIAYSGEVENG